MFLSLPPAIRSRSKYMLLLMLIPAAVKNDAQKKYFDFAAKFELDDLCSIGVDGIKVIMFSTSMDTPGRSDLLGVCHYYYCLTLLLLTNKTLPLLLFTQQV